MSSMAAPWSPSKLKAVYVRAFSLLVILFMAFAVTQIMASSARANGFEGCDTVTIVGDTHGTGIQGIGAEQKLREQGVRNVNFFVQPRRSIRAVNDQIRANNFDGQCVIVEAGTGNVANSPEDARRNIDMLMNTLSGAKKVYWVTPLSSKDAPPEWSTDTFRSELAKTSAPNFHMVDVQGLSDRPELFDSTGVTMTNRGYEERFGITVDTIMNAPNPDGEAPPDSTSPPNPDGEAPPDSTSPPNPDGEAPPDSTSPPSDGGEDTSPPIPPGEGPQDGLGTPEGTGGGGGNHSAATGLKPWESLAKDGFRGEANELSPWAFAQRVPNIAGFNEANKYLTIYRWDSPPIPTPMINLIDPGTYGQDHKAKFVDMSMSSASATMKSAFSLVTFAFSPNVASGFLRMSDGMFGKIFGGAFDGGSSAGRTGMLFGSLISVAFILAIVSAIGGGRGLLDPKQLAVRAGTSVGKYLAMITLIIVMGHQSSRNNPGNDPVNPSEITNVIQGDEQPNWVSQLPIPGQGAEEALQRINDSNSNHSAGAVQSINHPGSWRPGSLGWIFSVIYYLGNQIGQAFSSLIRVFTGFISDFVRNLSGGVVVGNQRIGSACDRYVDAMHFAYSKTSVADRNGGVAHLLRTIDLMYYDYYYRAYAHMYGGETYSSANSWCVATERRRGTPPGEWLMLGRTAGLYKEAAGTGNLLRNNDRSYTDGFNRMTGADANIQNGIVGPPDGYLVAADGKWTDASPEVAMPNRADAYMGNGDSKLAPSSAQFYFAACGWAPKHPEAILHPDWAGVRAMGITGGIDGDEFDLSVEERADIEKVKEKVQEAFEKRDKILRVADDNNRKVQGFAQGKADAAFANRDSWFQWELMPFLQKNDCMSPRIFPIGLDEDENKFGFGSRSPWANRWDYSVLPPIQFENISVGSVASFISSTVRGKTNNSLMNPNPNTELYEDSNAFVEEASKKAEDSPEPGALEEIYEGFIFRDRADYHDPEKKFGVAQDPNNGFSYANEFFMVNTGRGGMYFVPLGILVTFVSGAMFFLLAAGGVLGFVANFLMSFLILILSLAFVVIMVTYLFKVNKFNKGGK